MSSVYELLVAQVQAENNGVKSGSLLPAGCANSWRDGESSLIESQLSKEGREDEQEELA